MAHQPEFLYNYKAKEVPNPRRKLKALKRFGYDQRFEESQLFKIKNHIEARDIDS